MPDRRSQIGAVAGRHLRRRRRSAAKSRAPRCRAAGARKRPCVGPPVADRSSGRLGSIRLNGALGEPSDTRGRSNASFAFPTLRRVVHSTTIETRKHESEASSSASRSFRPVTTGLLRSRSEERTNERASGRPYELALDVRADEQFFFYFKYAQRYILRTQHCHGSVSRDRMAHMWRAHSVGRAILPRS